MALKKSKKNKYFSTNKNKKNRFSSGGSSRSSDVFQQKTIQQAVAFYQKGHLIQAENLFSQVLLQDPNHPEALYFSGVISHQRGMNVKAVELLNKALDIRPDLIPAYNVLINALVAQGTKKDAVPVYRKLLSLQPDSPEINNNFGVLLDELGMTEEALVYFRKTISINPKEATTHFNMGNVLRELGRLSDSIDSYKKALSLRPDYVEAFRVLSLARKHTELTDDISDYEKMYVQGSLTNEKKVHLGFALGKIFEDLKDYDKSFAFLIEANYLKRKSYNYSIKNDHDRFERIKQTFSQSFFSSHRETGDQDRTPIFLVGLPRSGSSLIEQILASHTHTQVFGAGEVSILFDLVYDTWLGIKTKPIPEFLSDLNGDRLTRMGSDYIARIRRYSKDSAYITDKNLFNFQHVGLIKAILPNAKVIHCKRNPMDNGLSIFKNFFESNEAFKFAYNLIELGQYSNLYRDLMEHWERVLPGFVYTINYEEMVSDQENQSRRLLEFCGLPFDEACLNFFKKERSVKTISSMQVRQPIYKSSVELWRRYEKHLEPLRIAIESTSDNIP
jgi:tetratricopeptide (TPR) repeat protein